MRYPLDVSKKFLPLRHGYLLIVLQIMQPIARPFDSLMLCWPASPCSAVVVRLHQDAKKRVIAEPRAFFLAEFSKLGLPLIVGVSIEVCECLFEQAQF